MTAATKTRRPKPTEDSYLRLAAEWHPRPIRTAAEHDRAFAAIKKLVLKNEDTLDVGESDYLEAVTAFLTAYDDEHTPRKAKKKTPAERLQWLMEQSEMTVSKLAKIIGSQPTASRILAGKREPSKAVIRKLATHFKVDAGYFL